MPLKIRSLSFCSAILGLSVGAGCGFEWSPAEEPGDGYRVQRVLDGDSVLISQGGTTLEVRLAGIDAPEHRQPYGNAARDELQRLVRGQQLTLKVRDQDRYGRTVALLVREDGLEINEELVRRGAAWVHRSYGDLDWFSLETQARQAEVGLWGLSEPAVPPWEWRQRQPRSGK